MKQNQNPWQDKYDERNKTYDYYCVKGFNIQTEPSIPHNLVLTDKYSGRLVLRIIAESPLFIGSGEAEIGQGNTQYFRFARVGNQIVIPGSSLKGAIRIYLEALSPSCLGGNCKNEKLCPACRLFGAQDYQGRVYFNDANLESEAKTELVKIPQRWYPPEERERPCPSGWRRFYFFHHPKVNITDTEYIEVISENSKFLTEIEFTNLEKWELGLLFLSMGLVNDYKFSLKMGGAKNRGYGRIRFELISQVGKIWKGFPFEKRSDAKMTLNTFTNSYFEKCKNWNIEQDIKKLMGKFKRGAPDGEGRVT